MGLFSGLKNLVCKSRNHPAASRKSASNRVRPQMEALEDRLAMTVSAVYNPSALTLTVHGDNNANQIRLFDAGNNNIQVFSEQGSVPVVGLNGQLGSATWGGVVSVTVYGGDRDDAIYANGLQAYRGSVTLHGDAGNDYLSAGNQAAWMYGGAHDDTLLGSWQGDLLMGGTGHDLIMGFDGNDWLFGDDFSDSGTGHGSDLLVGGPGADYLSGGGGDDILVAGRTLWDGDINAMHNVHGLFRTWGFHNWRSWGQFYTDSNAFSDSDRDTVRGGAGNDYFAVEFGQDNVTDNTEWALSVWRR